MRKNKFFYKNRYRNKNRETGNKNFSFSSGCNDECEVNVETVKKNGSHPIRDCPYKGWDLYFAGEEYDEDSPTVQRVKGIETFLKENPNLYNVADIERSLSFPIDVNILLKDPIINSSWETFEEELKNNPFYTLSCIGLAIYQIVSTALNTDDENTCELESEQNSILAGKELSMIYTRLLSYGPILQLRNLKSNYFGKLITVRGTIIRVGSVKLVCTWMAFQCDICESVQCFRQLDGIYTPPKYCCDRECRSKTFTPLLSSPYTKTVSFQNVRLQEIVTDDNRESGRVPRSIDCELIADLVDTCSPGEVSAMTGIIKIRNVDENSRQKNPNIFHQYMDVISVMNCKNSEKGGIPGIEFTEKNYNGIKEIFSEKNVFRLIVQSLCPTIFGHEIVKAGLILAMFGGCQRYEDCRGNPHVLIVGDPGLGKSRMLQACANTTPRGVYVCGNVSTTSGLTVSLGRETGGDYILEAGALVLSDQGCCCIDEFDKMSSQHQALLEAMEQQTVSIAKSGVICTLPCRASILAAANPVGGHYNKAKTVAENLKLGPALLSRFDLIFILMDQPSVETDSMLSSHVMALHSGEKGMTTISSFSSSFFESPLQSQKESLLSKLKLLPGEELDLIPHQLLRKYIAYAKQYVKPKISEKASEILIKFYTELRQCHQNNDSTPVTPRQLESLIRFTEARAKLELREEATAEDAEEVVEILRHSLLDMYVDEFGKLDFMRSQNGSGTSSKNQTKKFISALQKRSEMLNKSTFSYNELKELATHASIGVSEFSNFLSTLNLQGYLLKKGNQTYQLLSVD
ncbi:DNA replication licensing factor MCM8, putative [Pediculus humanus corporis]|uniref:DNA helicase MCM8 n=1 Tax=Pediculus humanus subsp. corporis TaxID=121224 RepID=E0VG28_PEDHC|nr:DNA replication licensing factor MCM8, putative [Pediculus humanus corporis]EEB12334.1 DNA replication licensing factor MCM8, putative [Pediculus humanus corporis]